MIVGATRSVEECLIAELFAMPGLKFPIVAAQRVRFAEIAEHAAILRVVDNGKDFGSRGDEQVERVPYRLGRRQEMFGAARDVACCQPAAALEEFGAVRFDEVDTASIAALFVDDEDAPALADWKLP